METTPGKRIQLFREYKGYKRAAAFAEASGLKAATLSSIETDRTAPSFESISAIIKAFPDLNLDWLLTGTGEMLRGGRTLTPMPHPPSDPTVPVVVAEARGPQLVPESDTVKELKERIRSLEADKRLLEEILRSGGDFSKLARVSFSLGNDEADTQAAPMWLAA